MTTNQCTATSSQTGQRCKRAPMNGTTVCATHGGRAPQVRAAAERKLAEDRAAKAAARFAVPIVTTPEDALLGLVHSSAGLVAYYEARVRAVESEDGPGALVSGVTKTEYGTDKNAHTDLQTTEAQPIAWLTLFNSERDRLAKYSSEAIKAGVEERRVRLAERQGVMVAKVLESVLNAMLAAVLAKLTSRDVQMIVEDTWNAAIPDIVPRELAALETGDEDMR